jgi:hypothetical protein
MVAANQHVALVVWLAAVLLVLTSKAVDVPIAPAVRVSLA